MKLTHSLLLCLLMAAVVRADPPGAVEALKEVNDLRKARGLKPLAYDADLTAGAMQVAKFRADRLMFGHTSDDHKGLPKAAFANFPWVTLRNKYGHVHTVSSIAGGCAAYPASQGWASCAMYGDYEYGGAAYVIGKTGLRHMQLFVGGGRDVAMHADLFR